MAKRSGLGLRFWYHGRDISGDVGQLNSIGSPRAVLDFTGIDAVAFVRQLSHGNGIVDFSGFFNKATDQEHDALSGLRTTDIVTLLAMGTTLGDVMAGLVGKQDGYALDRTSDGGLSTGAVVLSNESPLEWGVMLSAGAETIASAGSLSRLDENGVGGSTAFGGVGYLQFESLSSGNPALLIEDSANDSDWLTLLTFVEGTPPLGERKTVVGNVDRYLRVTATGTFSNAVVAVGFRRGQEFDIIDLSS
jgi:hypothetical protein